MRTTYKAIMHGLSARKLFALENTVSFTVFATMGLAQLFALLLYLYPRSEWFWFLSLKFNRLSEPAINAFGFLREQTGVMTWLVIGLLCALPIVAQRYRFWLTTSILAHFALGLCIVSASDLLQQHFMRHQSASLSSIVDPDFLNWNLGSVAAATAALVVLCFMNHVLYLRHAAKHRGHDA